MVNNRTAQGKGILMATNLGNILRDLRTHHKERLLDMAKKLNVSSAFLSAIEHGRKIPPVDLADRLERVYVMQPALKRKIRKEIEASTNGVTIKTSRKLARETAAVFARKVNKLSEDKLNTIRNLIDGED